MKKFVMIFVFLAIHILAQPSTITYQGLLYDDSNELITATENIKFDIYLSEAGGLSQWTETHNNINVVKGMFSVELGSVTPFGSLDFSQELWLEITVSGNTLSPRISFNASSYAMAASNLDGGAAGSIPYQTSDGTTAMLLAGTAGEVLTMNAGATAPEWLPTIWTKNNDDIIYSSGNVGIGSGDPNDLLIAPLNVEGGIRYFGNPALISEPGLLYYDSTSPGSFKYFDNNGNTHVLGTGSIDYSGSFWDFQDGDITTDHDVIAGLSLGIGDDINLGSNFGTTSLLFKEINIRILFDDSDNLGSTPYNDWQITINDMSYDGDNYFAVEDITHSTIPFKINAGASTNSLYIADNGDIGFGTDNPIADLHLIRSNSPTIRLEQDSLDGLNPYKWDMVGNENNFYIRDGNTGYMPFRIHTGAANGTVMIGENGNTGFGIFPERTVHINGSMRLEPTTEPVSPSAGDIYFDSSTNKLRCFDGSQWNDLW